MSKMDLSPAFTELTVQGETDLHQKLIYPGEEP